MTRPNGSYLPPSVKPVADFRTEKEWDSLEHFGDLMQRHVWRAAVTMPENPHNYTERKRAVDVDAYDWAVDFITAHGHEVEFGRSLWRVLDVNEHRYWALWPAWRPGRTVNVINRRRLAEPHLYDRVAARYDEMFIDDRSIDQDCLLFDVIAQYAGSHHGNVLDVGCGTGLYLNHGQYDAYMGIDPSAGMIQELRHRFPYAAVLQTDLTRFAPALSRRRFDTIVALYGVGSYLSDAELSRIPCLLRRGGVAIVMFYQEGVTPVSYERSGVEPPPLRTHDPSTFPAGSVISFDYYDVAVYQNGLL